MKNVNDVNNMNDNKTKQIKGSFKKSFFDKSFWSYVIGFAASILLTWVAYYLVVNRNAENMTAWKIALTIAVLALIQFVIQLFYFMHLRLRTKPRWQLGVFLFMFLIVFILVGGSIWIMSSLNNRMIMTPDQVNQYMQDQAGL